MKITIVYDNEIVRDIKGLKAGWGFSCFIQTKEKNILFDTGWDGDVLVSNIRLLGLTFQDIDLVVISHSHWDHCGGLARLLNLNDSLEVYVPKSFSKHLKEEIEKRANIYEAKELAEILSGVYTTGEIEGSIINGKTKTSIKEQSLIILTIKGLIVITGCAHSGINKILNSANKLGKIYGLLGGFHDFEEYSLLRNINLIVPTHCTKNKRKIFSLFSKNCIEGGVGYQLVV
ncbi:MBL fold hydrolase [Candidatus Atribacteria bacterium HGW-Atribacteria-1]|nr:MAG: MBL fold hydrolase [Candidatus Atribacteria bacterium HGW-Atribacteria-1]